MPIAVQHAQGSVLECSHFAVGLCISVLVSLLWFLKP